MSPDIDEVAEDKYEKDEAENLELSDSTFQQSNTFAYFKQVIKPDVAKLEKEALKSKIPLFTKELKVSNITNQHDIDILNNAMYNISYLQYAYALLDNENTPEHEKAQSLLQSDWLALQTNFILALSSSRGGFERRIEHSKFLTTKKLIDDRTEQNTGSWIPKFGKRQDFVKE